MAENEEIKQENAEDIVTSLPVDPLSDEKMEEQDDQSEDEEMNEYL